MICKHCERAVAPRRSYSLFQGPARFYFCGEAHADQWAAERLFSGGPHKHAHAATGHVADRLRNASSTAMPVRAHTELPPAALLY